MNVIKFWIKAFLAPCMPLYLGGDSDSSTSTSSNTTNNVTSIDRRAVASDEAIALTGDGNSVSRTANNTTNFSDSSDRSTYFSDSSDRSTHFSDSSNRSTNFADSSNRSVSTNTTFTDQSVDNSNRSVNYTTTTSDYGSVRAALESITTMGRSAIGLGDTSVTGMMDAMKTLSANSLQLAQSAFTAAQKQSADSIKTVDAFSAFAADNSKLTSEAFNKAQTDANTQNTPIYIGLAVIAAIGVAWVMKRG